jgi:hypothetical protein
LFAEPPGRFEDAREPERHHRATIDVRNGLVETVCHDHQVEILGRDRGICDHLADHRHEWTPI